MAQIKIDAGALKTYLRDLGSRLERGDAPLKRIGAYVVEITKQGFREGKDPGTGSPWPKLSDRYGRWKARHGYSATPLTLKSRLRRSIHYIVTGKRKVAVGTDTTYGRHHQFGEGVPKRRFLGVSRGDRREIEAIVGRWIQGRKK